MTAPDLLLVPTAFEARGLFPDIEPAPGVEGVLIEHGGRPLRLLIGGFGLAAAGVRAAHAMARHPEGRVILAGIAGSFDLDRAPEASLTQGIAVHLDGIGAGEGEDHVPARDLPFPPLPGPPADPLLLADGPRVPNARAGGILAVASASGGRGIAERRLRAYPNALVEDMESWSVALAARELGRELVILRAVSNLAGVRDPARWRVADAVDRLREGLAALPSAT